MDHCETTFKPKPPLEWYKCRVVPMEVLAGRKLDQERRLFLSIVDLSRTQFMVHIVRSHPSHRLTSLVLPHLVSFLTVRFHVDTAVPYSPGTTLILCVRIH